MRFTGATHGDFNSMLVARHATDGQRRIYREASSFTRLFLDAALKGGVESRCDLERELASGRDAGRLTWWHGDAELPALPTEAERAAAEEAAASP